MFERDGYSCGRGSIYRSRKDGVFRFVRSEAWRARRTGSAGFAVGRVLGGADGVAMQRLYVSELYGVSVLWLGELFAQRERRMGRFAGDAGGAVEQSGVHGVSRPDTEPTIE